jgi:hypothetical protein
MTMNNTGKQTFAFDHAQLGYAFEAQVKVLFWTDCRAVCGLDSSLDHRQLCPSTCRYHNNANFAI